jgi:hypothetical protein
VIGPRYSGRMNIAAILSEIDAEIEALRNIRSIIQGLSAPVHPLRRKRKRTSSQPQESDQVELRVERLPRVEMLPQIKVVPPKQRREYRPRTKPVLEMPRALARGPSTQPVFVRRTAVSETEPVFTAQGLSETALEAVVRQNLMGGIAQQTRG